MSRRRRKDHFDLLLDMLKRAPWWVGPILAVAAFLGIRFIVPLLLPNPTGPFDIAKFYRGLCPLLSWLIAIVILVAWVVAEAAKQSGRRLFDGNRRIEDVRKLPWDDFERFVTEAYKRQGYTAEHTGRDSADGGVDVELNGHGEKVLVQCKHWKVYKVGVGHVRELLGVVTAKRANRGILVTTGRFTEEAIAFARQNPCLELVHGPHLEALIEAGRSPSTAAGPRRGPESQRASLGAPLCPRCGKAMILRTARRGASAGEEFWGCSGYPGCKGTRPVSSQ